MYKRLRETFKEEMREVRKNTRIFKDVLPVITACSGTQYLDNLTKYFLLFHPEEIDKICWELGEEEKEAEYEIGRNAEIEREKEVNGYILPGFFDFNFWW